MVDFQVRPWQMVALFDKCVGYWPYLNWLLKGPILAYHLLVFTSICIPLAYNLNKNVGVNFLVVIKCTGTFMVIFSEIGKLVAISAYQDPRRCVYEKIFNHFNEISDVEEAKILRDYANKGFRYFAIYMFSNLIIATLFSFSPLIVGSYKYLFVNEHFVINLPLELNYGVDHSQHTLPIYLHFFVFAMSSIMVDLAFDLSFIMQVFHACALVKIVTIRLERATRIYTLDESKYKTKMFTERLVQKMFKKAIDLHSKSFELISLIEAGHSTCFFFLLLINTSIFGALIHVVNFCYTFGSLGYFTFRHLLAFAKLLIHFYVIFSQGQKIIDYTTGIFHACYNCKWLDMSRSMRTMWLIIMIRSSKPCLLTGGKCFVLSRETYSKMLKAGISYYTVFENKYKVYSLGLLRVLLLQHIFFFGMIAVFRIVKIKS